MPSHAMSWILERSSSCECACIFSDNLGMMLHRRAGPVIPHTSSIMRPELQRNSATPPTILLILLLIPPLEQIIHAVYLWIQVYKHLPNLLPPSRDSRPRAAHDEACASHRKRALESFVGITSMGRNAFRPMTRTRPYPSANQSCCYP